MAETGDIPIPGHVAEALSGLAPGARVVVAMSGGVDSALSAALCRRLGLDVVAITLQLYDHGRTVSKPGACCAGADIHDARRIAGKLDIPHYVLDYEARFRAAVIDDFADSYLAGETPIPCVRCNQKIKFRDLLETARGLGARALITGHYARRIEGASGPELWRAVDASRDQSYFLFATLPAELDFLRFPLGGFSAKGEVRRLAAQLGLAVAEKPDSQDICFVPEGRYWQTVARHRPGADGPGPIVDSAGRVLGLHAGITRFTVGQRRGLGLSGPEALYVLRIEPEGRRLVVGPRSGLERRALRLREMNWLSAPGGGELAAQIKIRSTRPAVPARVRALGDGAAQVELDVAETGVAPGQAGVLYRGERLLGGGWIAREAA